MAKKAMQKRGRSMAKASGAAPAKKGLSQEELAKQGGAELPDREAMSLVTGNIAAPVNLAAALNVLSDDSTAIAIAEQDAPITQST